MSGAEIEIDTSTGTLTLVDGVLFVGEIAPVAFVGYTPAEGKEVRLTLFAADGATPLADNSSDAAFLDLRGAELRKLFCGCRGAKSFRAMAWIVDATDGSADGDVLAAGTIPVRWSPAVFDAATGSVATLKGEKGDKGDPGAALTFADLTAEQKAALKGERGPQGERGIQGPQGVQGLQGIPGPKGDKGDTPDVSGFVKKESFETFNGLQLGDDASQRDVRIALQAVIGKLKSLASLPLFLVCAYQLSAGEAAALDATTEWQDVPPSVTVKGVVEQFAPAPATNRYPLFVIDLNPGEARVWQHLELKATTNNFENTDGMTFFTATTSNGEIDLGNITHDWCRLFVASKRADSDIRRWKRITNTGDLYGYAPLTLAIIVDPSLSFMRRDASKADNAAWLYEGNTNLIWSFSRIGEGVDAEAEKDQDGKSCWRMIMPTKWYSELPAWAIVPAEIPDHTDVTQYTPPWLEAIDDADTSYQRFATLTNVNQSVQYVTSTPNGTLNIEIPTGQASTRDWVVYCFFGAETSITLPAATWWMADEAFTNAIPANQPTALYFTQVTDGVYMLSRQELTSILIQH